MVTTVGRYKTSTAPVAHPTAARIVEMVGPAGAGKTTLAQALCQQSETIVMGEDIALRTGAHLLLFLRTLPTLLPVLLEQRQADNAFTWDEVKAMAYLTGWQAIFQRQAANHGALVLLDHGPVFRLAFLHAFAPARCQRPAFARWWEERCQQWAAALDVVIWLDAPNPILAERIDGRSQRHLVKGKAAQEATQFLERYRQSYQLILHKLTAQHGPRLLRFDTSQTSLDRVIQAVRAACDPEPPDNLCAR